MGMAVFTPTSNLPPLLRLSNHTDLEISAALSGLRSIYWPIPKPKPAPRSRTKKTRPGKYVPDSGYASPQESGSEDNEELEIIRADAFERAFAVKWLTGFLARSDVWLAECPDTRSPVIDSAITLLSAFAGDEPEESITRQWSFPRADGETVDVELNDAPISPDDHTSVGLQSWAAAIIMSENMCLDPIRFGLLDPSRPARILELGAGTGLVAIVAKKLDPSALVIATDYHTDVLDNCRVNLEANFPSSSDDVNLCLLDWESPVSTAPFDVPFDVILAADVIYHPLHALWIKTCVEGLLLKPNESGSGGGTLWLAMSLRIAGRHEGLNETVKDVFSASSSSAGLRLEIVEQETVGRQQHYGRVDESGYSLFKIEWILHE